jgi:hypothetical protein
MEDKDIEKITDIIREIFNEEDDERRLSLADSILDIDPANPVAKYIKWQSTDKEESIQDTKLLEEAVESLRPTIESMGEPEDDESEIYLLYVAMLADLATFLYISGEHDRAFDIASEFMKLDKNCNITGRMVYYAVLVVRGDFEEVLASVEDDICETPPGEYCKAIAVFEMEGICDKASTYLMDAISMDPDLPFYILGLWVIEEEDLDDNYEIDGYMEDTFMTVAVLAELWTATEERLAFLSVIAFAFGYLTGRMEGPDDTAMIEESYRELGSLAEIQESRDVLHAMLASGKEQDEVDEKALSILKETDYFGLFG